jgi:hypothetical protein
VIFSAVPGGTVPGFHLYPGLASWATLSRPFGTQFVSRVLTQALKPGSSQQASIATFTYKRMTTYGA